MGIKQAKNVVRDIARETSERVVLTDATVPNVGIIVYDLSQIMFTLGNKGTGAGAVAAIMRLIGTGLSDHQKQRTGSRSGVMGTTDCVPDKLRPLVIVFCLDDEAWVPRNKSITQKARDGDKDKKSAFAHVNILAEISKIGLKEPLPGPSSLWQYLAHNKPFARAMARFLAQTLTRDVILLPNTEVLFDIAGVQYWVRCDDKGIVRRSSSDPVFKDATGTTASAAEARIHAQVSLDRRVTYESKIPFPNRIGETDFKSLFFVRKLRETRPALRSANVLVMSRDLDLLVVLSLGLRFLTPLGTDDPEVQVYLDLGCANRAMPGGGIKKVDEIVHINAFVRALSGFVPECVEDTTENAVLHFALVLSLAGTDYLKEFAIHRYNTQRLVKAYRDYIASAGRRIKAPLVSWTIPKASRDFGVWPITLDIPAIQGFLRSLKAAWKGVYGRPASTQITTCHQLLWQLWYYANAAVCPLEVPEKYRKRYAPVKDPFLGIVVTEAGSHTQVAVPVFGWTYNLATHCAADAHITTSAYSFMQERAAQKRRAGIPAKSDKHVTLVVRPEHAPSSVPVSELVEPKDRPEWCVTPAHPHQVSLILAQAPPKDAARRKRRREPMRSIAEGAPPSPTPAPRFSQSPTPSAGMARAVGLSAVATPSQSSRRRQQLSMHRAAVARPAHTQPRARTTSRDASESGGAGAGAGAGAGVKRPRRSAASSAAMEDGPPTLASLLTAVRGGDMNSFAERLNAFRYKPRGDSGVTLKSVDGKKPVPVL